jgi:hypothetical protein
MSNESSLPVRRIEVAPTEGSGADGFSPCVIGKHILLSPERLVSYRLASWQPVVYDALLLAAAVEYCDRRQVRPGEGWGREFSIRLPVDDPHLWTSPGVSMALIDALSRLTGDRWSFEFFKGGMVAPGSDQAHFQMPEPSSVMIPFSNGMDSWSVARLLAGQPVVRVRLGGPDTLRHKRKRQGEPFERVPFRVPDRDFKEKTNRARGFKFALVSGLAAFLSGSSRVAIPESGQGALGPVFAAHRYGDYRTHPLFLRKMERFLRALLSHNVRYEFPRLYATKGQTLAAAFAMLKDPSWIKTRSCWQKPRQISVGRGQPLRHCGFCAACMLRRLSVHAAGLTEPATNYAFEDLGAINLESGMAAGFPLDRLQESQTAYAVSGPMHLDHLADLSRSPSPSFDRQIRELARAMDDSEEATRRNVMSLLAGHEAEWRAFLSSLPPKSFIRMRSSVVP